MNDDVGLGLARDAGVKVDGARRAMRGREGEDDGCKLLLRLRVIVFAGVVRVGAGGVGVGLLEG